MIKIDRSLCSKISNAIGVSMGEDSVALSHFMSGGKTPLRLVNVNHLTPYADKAEEKFGEYVKFLKETRYCPIYSNVLKGSYPYGITELRESDYRDYRYGLLDQYMPTFKEKTIIMCHHLGDATESYLMNVLKGQSNYVPMPLVTTRDIQWQIEAYKVVRPFMLTTKQDIQDYIKRNNLEKWVVKDPSNKDLTIRRNWVRLKLLPEIKTQYPGIETTVKKIYYSFYPCLK